nr:dihydrodipicolinate synthase family protein [Candidatus Sigynarchaeum springense]
MKINDIDPGILRRFRSGMVIPAMPLALDERRTFQETYQRALARYYIDAGAGGIAVGVHTTQFEIRNPQIGLFERVLSFVSRCIDEWAAKRGTRILKIAGVVGKTEQAVKEAEFVRIQGYHACLLDLSAWKCASEMEMLAHCRRVAKIMPVMGFYLQPAVGGRVLSYSFWRAFAGIDNVLGIKIAPFNRYQTLDVVRAVCDAAIEDTITLYTGNDDNIVVDLLTEYRVNAEGGEKRARIKGGLLGHWAVWTRGAVMMLEDIHRAVGTGKMPAAILSLAAQVTDCNAAFFDAANGFAGCIPGIHEVLRRQGLLPGTWCLNPREVLSPGQREEIDRVYRAYPHLNDDEFVKQNLSTWLEK